MIARALCTSSASHFLFVDANISWSYEDVIKMIVSKKNVIKKKICRIFDPFSNAMFNETIHISLQMTLNEVNACQVRLGCVCAMETMVMSATDEEYAKLGAMYVLMALTTVSRSARTAMPWLYESITG